MKIRTKCGHKFIAFSNGYIVSIFNGYGSYTENKFNLKSIKRKFIKTKYCEVAVIYNQTFVTKKVLDSSEDVEGYVTKKKLKEIIKKVRKLDGTTKI